MQCVFTLMKSEERRERVLAKAVGWFPGEFQVRRGFCDRFEGRDPLVACPPRTLRAEMPVRVLFAGLCMQKRCCRAVGRRNI
jgi:hypothetical protein